MSFPANIDLSSLDGSNGFKLSGEASLDFNGVSVASAGDVNGDGFADLIVGSRAADPNAFYAGASYVVFGKASGFAANLDLSSLDGSNGFRLSGVAAYDASGWSVASAGDVNGDGFADLIIGAPGAHPYGATSGASYVVFGEASGFAANFELSSLDGSNGFRISGPVGADQRGYSVASAGDVNGDGFADLIVGAPSADPNGTSNAGASYVVFGKASGFTANLDPSSLDGSNGFMLSGVAADDRSGYSVASAGDVNGDGFADLIVGALHADPNGTTNAGASYVVFGQASGFAANLDLSSLDGSNGFALSGVAADDYSGFSVASAGDVNGDGFDDLIVGIRTADPRSRNYVGASYVVFGEASGFAASIDLSSLDGSNGFKVSGVAGRDYGQWSVASAGDVNGDGFDDVIIGARYSYLNGDSGVGASYVVFGKASGFDANIDLSSLDGSNGFRVSGEFNSDHSGFSVSSAGDINGDGFADIVVGASDADPNGLDSGASYVIFGHATSDTTADAGGDLAVSVSDASINNAEKTAAGFTVAGLDGDASASVTFSDGTHQVVVHVTGNGAGSADLSTLDDGPITVSIGASDVAGNTATGTGTSLTLDTAPPSGITLTPNRLIDSVEIDGASYTVAGLQAGDTAVVTFSDGHGHDSGPIFISVNGPYSVPLTGFLDGTLISSIVVTDAAGNQATFDGVKANINNSTSYTTNFSSWNVYGAAQAAEAVLDGGTFTTITIKDERTTLQALSAGEIGTLGTQGVNNVDSRSDALLLTVDQYNAYVAAGIALTASDVVTVSDTAANLQAVLGTDLAGHGVDRLNASDELSITADQYLDLGSVRFLPTNTVTLADDGSNIAALSVAQIGGLVAGGIDKINASDDMLSLSIAQFNALGTAVVAGDDALTVTGSTTANQAFVFVRQTFTGNDSVVGGSGTDNLSLNGDYSGGLAFGAGAFSSIDRVSVRAGHDYALTTNDANVGAGALLEVNGSLLGAGDDLHLNGSAETNGRFKFVGGAGSDSFIGGSGNDIAYGGAGTNSLMGGGGADKFFLSPGSNTIGYAGVGESTGAGYDTVKGFNAGTDVFDLWAGTTVAGIDSDITAGRLSSGANFNRGLAAAVNGANLQANHAVLFTADAGNLANVTFMVVDINGTAGYQANADLVVRLDNHTGSLTTGNFS